MTSRAVPRPCSVININITITQAVREFLGHRRKVSAPLSSFRLGGKCKSSCRVTAACLDRSLHCWTPSGLTVDNSTWSSTTKTKYLPSASVIMSWLHQESFKTCWTQRPVESNFVFCFFWVQDWSLSRSRCCAVGLNVAEAEWCDYIRVYRHGHVGWLSSVGHAP